jgi:hypothetical protein
LPASLIPVSSYRTFSLHDATYQYVAIGTAVRKDRTRFAAINVMPQCKTNSWWSEPAMEELALATLTAASKEFKGDPQAHLSHRTF